jgi:nucleoside-diphosphate-sugar epimerase
MLEESHSGQVAAHWRTGHVAVTGASGQVGRALVRRLEGLANDVRPVGRGDDLSDAVRDAEVVVHLAGTLRPKPDDSYEDSNIGTVERMLRALERSSVDRIVFLSYVGADRASPNDYLRAKGRAEELLHRCGRDAVVLRCTHVFGPPDDPGPTVSALLARPGRSAWILGTGRQRVAPVYREDVVDAIVRAALDLRAPHGRFDLPGPDAMTFDRFVDVVNGSPVPRRHVPAGVARLLAHATRELTPALVDVIAADSLGEQTRAGRAFGLVRRRLVDVYGRPAQAAA